MSRSRCFLKADFADAFLQFPLHILFFALRFACSRGRELSSLFSVSVDLSDCIGRLLLLARPGVSRAIGRVRVFQFLSGVLR